MQFLCIALTNWIKPCFHCKFCFKSGLARRLRAKRGKRTKGHAPAFSRNTILKYEGFLPLLATFTPKPEGEFELSSKITKSFCGLAFKSLIFASVKLSILSHQFSQHLMCILTYLTDHERLYIDFKVYVYLSVLNGYF